jgi:hypothetical protein
VTDSKNPPVLPGGFALRYEKHVTMARRKSRLKSGGEKSPTSIAAPRTRAVILSVIIVAISPPGIAEGYDRLRFRMISCGRENGFARSQNNAAWLEMHQSRCPYLTPSALIYFCSALRNRWTLRLLRRVVSAMEDLSAKLEKLLTEAEDCYLIGSLATDLDKRELFHRLAVDLRAMARDIQVVIAERTARN